VLVVVRGYVKAKPGAAVGHIPLERFPLSLVMGKFVEPYHQLVLLHVDVVEVFPIGGRFQREIILLGEGSEKAKRVQRKENVIVLDIQGVKHQHLGLARLLWACGTRKQHRDTQDQRDYRPFHRPAPQRMAFLKSCVNSLLSNRPG
jgi:hypothetical protein